MNLIVASRFKRCLATFVDGCVVTVLAFPMMILALFLIPVVKQYLPQSYLTTDLVAIIMDVGANVITQFCALLYFAFFESSKYQATLGKKLFYLYVSTAEGKKLTFWKAMVRYLMYIASSLPFFVISAMYAGHKVLVPLAGDYKALLTTEGAPALIATVAFFMTPTMLTLIGVAILMVLIWFLPTFFTKKRQCLYEILTKTMVNTQLVQPIKPKA